MCIFYRSIFHASVLLQKISRRNVIYMFQLKLNYIRIKNVAWVISNLILFSLYSSPRARVIARDGGRVGQIHRQHRHRLQAGRAANPAGEHLPLRPAAGPDLQMPQDTAPTSLPDPRRWGRLVIETGRHRRRQQEHRPKMEGRVGYEDAEIPTRTETGRVLGQAWMLYSFKRWGSDRLWWETQTSTGF